MIHILYFLIISFFFFSLQNLYSADENIPTQTVKGTVVNFQTQQPVIGASVSIAGTKLGSYTLSNGTFKIKNVPAGRYNIRVHAIGYEPQQFNIVVTSGKEEQVNFQLQESFVQLEEVKVTAQQDKFAPINESAIVSSTAFTIDDVERFAGSRMDPARMAQNFAGVVGANDLRNDIIIRGGSPTELLWRVDGLDIPNPNHFATQGATGGPICAINSSLLDNSDFLTGAFPAEYGDKISGVFDLHTRKGNDERYEFLGQFGFNGFELGAEGPLNFTKGSLIANYRYSFLDLLEKMGMDFGFSGIPRYQDGTLKIDLPAGDKHQISLTGIFGLSKITIEPTEDKSYVTDYRITNGTDLFSFGLNWKYLMTDNLYGNLLLGTVYNKYFTNLDSVTFDNEHNEILSEPNFKLNSIEAYHTAKYSLHYSPNSRHFVIGGIESRFRYYDLLGKQLNPDLEDPWNMSEIGTSLHLLSYINWNWRITEKITSNIGIHSQYLEISKKSTIEPRLALSWQFLPLHSFRLGFGVHQQSLPLLIYYTAEGNDKLDFMQALHYVAGYTYQLSYDALLKLDCFYKDITKVPVERYDTSSWSFLNSGANFGIVEGMGDEAKSTGIGRTYGVEFSLAKNFTNHYYITATASYIRQQYKGSDNILRFGAFDNIFVGNLLAGYEWILSPSFTIEFAGKYTMAGGGPYTPIDIEESRISGETEYIDSEAFSMRKPDYSRFDLRIDFRHNMKGVSIIGYVSGENVYNSKNVLSYSYSKNKDGIKQSYQLGFFFVGGMRVEF